MLKTCLQIWQQTKSLIFASKNLSSLLEYSNELGRVVNSIFILPRIKREEKLTWEIRAESTYVTLTILCLL